LTVLVTGQAGLNVSHTAYALLDAARRAFDMDYVVGGTKASEASAIEADMPHFLFSTNAAAYGPRR
jgi:hypothetical protein